MLAAHVPVLRRALLPIGLFDERELNFLPEAAAGEISTAMALDRWRSGSALSASRLHADSRDGGLRSDRTGSPRQKRSPLRQSRPVRHTDKRAVEIDEGATSPDAARSSAVPSMTALARNRGALCSVRPGRDRDY